MNQVLVISFTDLICHRFCLVFTSLLYSFNTTFIFSELTTVRLNQREREKGERNARRASVDDSRIGKYGKPNAPKGMFVRRYLCQIQVSRYISTGLLEGLSRNIIIE